MKVTAWLAVLIVLCSCQLGNEEQPGEKHFISDEHLEVSQDEGAKIKLELRDPPPATAIVDTLVVGRAGLSEERKIPGVDSSLQNYRIKTLESEFTTIEYYALSDTMIADLNGDRITDTAFFSLLPDVTKLVFIKGGSGVRETLTYETGEGGTSSNFNWVDYWGLTQDTTTYGTSSYKSLQKNDRIALKYPSLVLRVDELGGALLTFADNKFRYVHQSD